MPESWCLASWEFFLQGQPCTLLVTRSGKTERDFWDINRGIKESYLCAVSFTGVAGRAFG